MTDHKGGRARTGGLLWKSGKWYGRWTAEVEGETMQVVRSMNTTSKPVARRRLERAMAGGAPGRGVDECPETFEEAARRVVQQQKQDGSTIWKDRLHRLETYAFPEIGRMVPTDITVPDVKAVLEIARDGGKAYDTQSHQVGGIVDVLAERACKQGQDFSQIQGGATEQIRTTDLIASGSCNAVAWWERALQCSLAARATELAGCVNH